jgi:hypothetical protein
MCLWRTPAIIEFEGSRPSDGEAILASAPFLNGGARPLPTLGDRAHSEYPVARCVTTPDQLADLMLFHGMKPCSANKSFGMVASSCHQRTPTRALTEKLSKKGRIGQIGSG